jgi:formylglycine-generating enzyme required for sulfatase activity
VQYNAEWTPLIQEFEGVLMAQVPPGCLGAKCFDTPFWIDVYEVTNQQYGSSGSFSGAQQPRENISWNEALAYCESRGARLPYEDEWEYAARGPDLLIYPWGNTYYNDNATSNTHGCVPGQNNLFQTCNVGTHPGGISWVGAQDMAGNVWEWMMDTFAGETKVIRGGSYGIGPFDNPDHGSAYRASANPEYENPGVGFRCTIGVGVP